jgi:hypothetical protein
MAGPTPRGKCSARPQRARRDRSIEEAPGEPPASALDALDAITGEALLRDASLPRAIASPVVLRGRVYPSFGNVAVGPIGVELAGGITCIICALPRP